MSNKKLSNTPFLGYQVPLSTDNEGVIISTLFSAVDLRSIIMKRVDYTHFRNPECKTIYWTICEIINSKLDLNIDLILLKSNSCPTRTFVDFTIVSNLIKNYEVASEANIQEHIESLVLDHTKTKLLETGLETLVETCISRETKLADLQDITTYMARTLEAARSSTVSEFKGMDVLIPEFRERQKNKIAKRTTGFRQLDNLLTEGLKEQTVTIICGLSGMGKSSFALSMIKNLSHRDQPTGLFALEMNNMGVVMKLLAYNSQLAVSTVVKDLDSMEDIERSKFIRAANQLERNKSIYICDKPQMLKNIEQQVGLLQERLKTNYVPVFIDLFGKIRDFRGSENFARDYEQQLNEVQDMCKRLDIPIVLVAQINRAVNQRKDKRPTMSDLKNAGAFEEVADLILGVHRPNYDASTAIKSNMSHEPDWENEYGEDEFEVHTNNIAASNSDPLKNIAEIIVMKQRQGVGNTIANFYFNPINTCYEPLSAEHQTLINQSKPSIENG